MSKFLHLDYDNDKAKAKAIPWFSPKTAVLKISEIKEPKAKKMNKSYMANFQIERKCESRHFLWQETFRVQV